jgi:amidophosphoribosyltransferase
MSTEFRGKHVLLVDDSIVRGTTSSQIIEMARAAGARKVTFASAAPPIRHPHVYGINIPTESELIAAGRTIPEICELLGADHLIYQEVDDLVAAIMDGQTDQHLDGLDMSCFTGEYVTGTVDQEYLDWVATAQES